MEGRIDIVGTAFEGLHSEASAAKRAQQPERHGRFPGAGTGRGDDEAWGTGWIGSWPINHVGQELLAHRRNCADDHDGRRADPLSLGIDGRRPKRRFDDALFRCGG